jgi:transposase
VHRDGEAVGQSFTIAASTDGVAILLRTLHARDATAAQTLIGLEASGHLWENLEAALVGAGYRVIVLNPLQTRRYRDVVRRKATTDDIDAHVIARPPARAYRPGRGQPGGNYAATGRGAAKRNLLPRTFHPRRGHHRS